MKEGGKKFREVVVASATAVVLLAGCRNGSGPRREVPSPVPSSRSTIQNDQCNPRINPYAGSDRRCLTPSAARGNTILPTQ